MNENNGNSQEVEEVVEIDEEASVDNEFDDDFDYDDEGNIILPDDDSEEEEIGDETEEDIDEDSDEDDEDYDEDSEDGDDAVADEEQAQEEPSKEGEPEEPVEPNEDKKELEELRKKFELLKSQSKETLKKLGIDEEDELEGLIKLCAEADDKTVEDYKKEREEELLIEEARKMKQATEFEQVLAKDLAEIQAVYPDSMQYKSIKDFPKDVLAKFAKYRQMGLPAVDAYPASNPDGIRTYASASAKSKVINDNKSHLRTNVPVGSRNNKPHMSKEDLMLWREDFPHLSDREIVKLYARTLKN